MIIEYWLMVKKEEEEQQQQTTHMNKHGASIWYPGGPLVLQLVYHPHP